MYEYLLKIKVLFRLSWRATVGFAEAVLKKAFPHSRVRVPDYAHASRASSTLKLTVQAMPRHSDAGMALAFDSTGINVYTTSGWHQRKYGKDSHCRRREQWRKIHLSLDLDTMQIMSMEYTGSDINDCEVVTDWCAPLCGKVASVRADGAYDTQEFYRLIHGWGAQALIPPDRTSRAQDELKKPPKIKKDYLEQRDKIIARIREYPSFDEGLKHWKTTSGYHRRSLVEACMFRLKRIFGFYLHQKTEPGRKNEMITKVNLLNIMASFGRAEYAC